MSLPPDTGAVELRVYSEYTLQRLARGERLDGRRLDELRRPSVVRDGNVVTATARHTDAAAAHAAKHNSRGSSGRAGDAAVADDDANADETLLSAVMCTDNKGSCVTAAVHGVLGPPRAQQPHEGRVNVVLRAPLLFIDSGNNSSSGYAGAATPTDAALLQLEGYVLALLRRCMDSAQLLLLPGEACWVLTVTITLLHVDGGVRAAALHAAVAALHTLVLPRTRLPDGTLVEQRTLRWRCVPVACTYGVLRMRPEAAMAATAATKGEASIDDKDNAARSSAAAAAAAGVLLLADTSAIEEHVLHSTITVAVDEAGAVVDVCHVGDVPLPSVVLLAAVEAAAVHAPALRRALFAPSQPRHE